MTTDSAIQFGTGGVGSLRVLVVDDEATDRLAVRRCLQQSGLTVTVAEASSAADALGAFQRGTCDCVLLDYYLPDMPALALFETLRSRDPDVPIVMFTGRGDEEIAVELMKAGASDYLPKASMTPERLATALRHATGMARARAAQRQAEADRRLQEGRFRTLANAIPQLAWMTDTSGARQWFNQRWLDYTGRTLEEMQGWGWLQVHHPDHVERVRRRVSDSCASGEPWEDTYPLRGKDGSYRWFLSRALPIRESGAEITGWLGTNTDVTDQKNAEAARERALGLAQEARDRAEQATRAREDLLAIVAHDLRNPLHIIMSSAARLKTAGFDEKALRYIGFIEQSANSIDTLVSDLLDVSNIESGTFSVRRSTVDLRAILEEARERFEMLAREHNITLDWDVDAAPASFSLDRDRLLQVVSNLLGNALKFTPESGHVAFVARGNQARLELVVRDSGTGIAAENLERIFDRHWRGDRESRAGAGLGLAICKGIVEAHGGEISVVSHPDDGSEFTVSIPALPAE